MRRSIRNFIHKTHDPQTASTSSNQHHHESPSLPQATSESWDHSSASVSSSSLLSEVNNMIHTAATSRQQVVFDTPTNRPTMSPPPPHLSCSSSSYGPSSSTLSSALDDRARGSATNARNKITNSSSTETCGESGGIRLRYKRLNLASRAMLFFRRTNSSTTDTNSSTGQHRQQSGEINTTASSSNHSFDTEQRQRLAAGSGQEVPRFIVPKLNTLKMPLVCRIKSLDGQLMREVFVHRYELGQYLLESLKVSLGLNDTKYFGLKMAKSLDEQEDLRNVWLDLNQSVCKQIKSKVCKKLIGSVNDQQNQQMRSIDFYLRIKFYPPNLARAQDEFLRNYLWLQLRRDLRLGKLTSSMNNLAQLMATVLQFELGDCNMDAVDRIQELNILPNQDLIEEQAIELWSQRFRGVRRHQAQMQFLRNAVILETYGFDYYPVRDHQRKRAYLLGFNYAGCKTIRNGRIVHHFSWHSMSKVSYERRMIIFHVDPTGNSKRKQILGFKCLSNEDCQSLYMRLLEQKYFFTIDLIYFDKYTRRPSPGGLHGPHLIQTIGELGLHGEREQLSTRTDEDSSWSCATGYDQTAPTSDARQIRQTHSKWTESSLSFPESNQAELNRRELSSGQEQGYPANLEADNPSDNIKVNRGRSSRLQRQQRTGSGVGQLNHCEPGHSDNDDDVDVDRDREPSDDAHAAQQMDNSSFWVKVVAWSQNKQLAQVTGSILNHPGTVLRSLQNHFSSDQAELQSDRSVACLLIRLLKFSLVMLIINLILCLAERTTNFLSGILTFASSQTVRSLQVMAEDGDV